MRRLGVIIFCALALPAASAQAWTWPVDGPVLRPFVFDSAHPYSAGQHRGIDIGADAGASVRAPVDGTVSFAGVVPNGGETVSIQTSSGYTATLLHLGSIDVKRGAAVAEGQTVVGAVADDADQPYVYFGVRVTNAPQGYVDPLTLLPVRAATDPPAGNAVASTADSSNVAPTASSPAEQPPVADSSAAPVDPAPPVEPAPTQSTPPATDIADTTHVSAGDEPATGGAHSASENSAPPVDTVAAPAVISVAASAPATAASESVVPTVVPDATTPVPTASPNPFAADPLVPRPLVLPAQLPLDSLSSTVPSVVMADVDSRSALPRSDVVKRVASPAAVERHSSPASGVPATRRQGENVSGVALPAAICTCVCSVLAFFLGGRRLRERRRPARIMSGSVVQPAIEEDPRRAGLAVCERSEASGPRRRVRGSGRHLRALPPSAWERRDDGERDRRARHARDGDGRQAARLAA